MLSWLDHIHLDTIQLSSLIKAVYGKSLTEVLENNVLITGKTFLTARMVPANNFLFEGCVSAKNLLFTRRVPAKKYS